MFAQVGRDAWWPALVFLWSATAIVRISLRLCVVKDSGACLLVVHVCRTVDRVVGHPRPSLSGIGVPWVSLPGPTDVP